MREVLLSALHAGRGERAAGGEQCTPHLLHERGLLLAHGRDQLLLQCGSRGLAGREELVLR